MNTHFSEHDDEAQLSVDPATNPDEELDALTQGAEEPSGEEHVDDTKLAAPKKRAKRSTGGQARRRRPREDGIIELRMPARGDEPAKPSIGAELDDEDDAARDELVAQGFTSDEAARIVDLSSRLGTSREARDAEASLRRLRFTRWLVERGVLNEFSA